MKKVNHYKKFLLVAAVPLVMLGGCKKTFDFEGSNNNPYQATVPVTQNLLTSSLRDIAGPINDPVGALYAQHLGEVQYTDASRFITLNFSYGTYYTRPLINLQTIIKLNTDPETANLGTVAPGGSNANQIATARILKAYFYFTITNRWGDIPYTDALKQGENLTPKFDKQADIYADLFKELKEAIAQFDGGATVKGDIFLSGNIARWKLFANSLRLIMAVRMSKIDPAKGKAEYLDALNAGVISTATQDFKYAFLNETANQNQWYARYLTRFDYAISKPLLDYMLALTDPRIPAFADKPTNGNANYVGMPYGLSVTTGIPNNSVSYIATNLRKQNAPEYILVASHVLFSMAEAEKLGWNAGNAPNDVKAQEYYEDAIEQSMRQYGVYTDPDYTTYIAQPGVAYVAADAIKLISEQRWIALYLNGFEAWNEWKRTGFPVLDPGPAPLNNGGQIPRRQGYTTSERDLNNANYQAVLSTQGPDELSTRMWWDKQ